MRLLPRILVALRAAVAFVLVTIAAAVPARAHDWEPFWIDVQTGFQMIDLRAFDAGNDNRITVDFVPVRAAGPSLSLGAGFRVLFLTLGARGTVTHVSDSAVASNVGAYDLWSLDAELGMRFVLGKVEPYLVFGAGYSGFGDMGDAIDGVGEGIDIHGANLRTALGFDWHVTGALSLGLRLTGEVLLLARPGIPVRDLLEPKQIETIGEARARLLEADGASVGWGLGLTGVLAVRF